MRPIFFMCMISTVLFTSCSNDDETTLSGDIPEITLEVVQKITEDPENEEGIISSMRYIDADLQGNVYIYDDRRDVIMKYLADGSFGGIIGASGEGPGEYADVTMMRVRGDSLYIFARDTQRLLVYDLDGEEYNTVQSESNLFYPVLEPTEYGYAGFHSNNFFSDEDNAIAHVYDHDLKAVHEDMLNMSDLYPGMVEQTLNVLAGSGPLNITMVDDYTALAAPVVYRGTIYRLSYDTGSGKWVRTDSSRTFEPDKLYQEVPNSSKQNDMSFIGAGMDEVANYRYLTRSNALFLTDEGYILHYTYRDEGSRRDFGVEVFDTDLNYLGYDILETDPVYGDDEFIYYDTPNSYVNGRFYRTAYDTATGAAGIEVLELKVN